MLKSDSGIIDKMMKENHEFYDLFNEHVQLEQDLEALLSLKFFPPEVETKIKEIKILKLRGKDKMNQLIAEFSKNN